PEGGSVHLLEWPEVPGAEADVAKWDALRALREKVTEAIEPLRRDKVVRSSLQAKVSISAAAVPAGFSQADLAELFITGTVSERQSEGVSVTPTSDAKCGRCWRHLPDVAEDDALCGRCEDVVATLENEA
ncbi:MAG: zinc finger domain-containing protein, partial [Pigmentiphaga sp.]